MVIKGGRVKFFSPKHLPPHIQSAKNEGSCDLRFSSPRSLFFAFLVPFGIIIHSQQLSTSFWGSLAFHWCILVLQIVCIWLNLRTNSSMNLCLFRGIVGDGLRPMVHPEANGHAALPPCPTFSCLKVRPPSARWNASMAFEHNSVSFVCGANLGIGGCHCWV